jgi:predicted phosphodiesterase
MKIAFADDLHLEFGDLDLRNTEQADVLVLAGDICVARAFRPGTENHDRQNRIYKAFFDTIAQEFPHIIYVLGNHEHYGNDWKYTERNMKDRLVGYKNIHLLEKEVVEIDGIPFLGTTLWTDLNKRDPNTMWKIPNMMNDFRLIKQDGSPITPQAWCDEHDLCINFLKDKVAEIEGNVVVVTHFTPSYMSCHPKYAESGAMNAGYHTELHDFIYDNPKIKVWAHGHTHDPFDYMINQTRVICNPRGYFGQEASADNWRLVYVEI